MSINSTDQHPESHLPDCGGSIYDLITSNDLPAIRSILTPLTLHDRQSIVYQKINNRTLLYHACDLGFSEIAKYLIDECGADLEEGYYSDRVSVTPMRVALKKFNFRMINLLLKRCIVSTNQRNEEIIADYAYEHNFLSLTSILQVHRGRFSKPIHFFPMWRRHEYHCIMLFPLVSEVGIQSNTDFFHFSINGDIAKIKQILKLEADTNSRNSVEEDALYAVILCSRKNTVNFFLNYKLYSIKAYVLALEFCGAVFIVFRGEKQEGLSCWKKSIRIRREYSIGFHDKRLTRLDTDLGIEFETEEEIDRFQNGYQVYLQSLIVFRRQLSRFSLVVPNAFVTVANHSIFKDNLLEPLQILAELYDLPSQNYPIPSTPSLKAIETINKLYDNQFCINVEDEVMLLSSFERLFDFLNADIWERLLRGGAEFYRIAYSILLDVALSKISNLERCNLSKEKMEWIRCGFKKIVKMYSYPYPTTLLHKAVEGSSRFHDVSFLLDCSADANCVDAIQNTPLHLVALLSNRDPDLSRLTHLLLRAGAHIDSMNKRGVRPVDFLVEKEVIQHPLQFISLQCLAAQAITKHGIPIPEKGYPKVLTKFIRLHSVLPL